MDDEQDEFMDYGALPAAEVTPVILGMRVAELAFNLTMSVAKFWDILSDDLAQHYNYKNMRRSFHEEAALELEMITESPEE